ncbi:hypothetical protein HK101_002706 [Irineochytrium annulatum]|nr:hypothetical protein HK101_002706 [Irineochytrium annulatum]
MPKKKMRTVPESSGGVADKIEPDGNGAIRLLDLPADILEMIFVIADARTTARFLGTCRRARSLLMDNEIFWKRKVVADFAFPGIRFEPATTMSCPRWQDVYIAHHNMLNGRYSLFLPFPSTSAHDSSYNAADDDFKHSIPNLRGAALLAYEYYPDDPNAPSTPDSPYDPVNLDHFIDRDELADLEKDQNLPLSSLVAPEQWDAYAICREPGDKLVKALESSALLRTFPRNMIDSRLTSITGRTDPTHGGWRRIRALGYNDTFDLFLGRAGGERLCVAKVEAGGGVGEVVWQSATGEKVEPLVFRGDVMVLATGTVEDSFKPVPPLVRVVWGLRDRARKYDMDVTADAAEAAVLPERSTVWETTVWAVRADGDMLILLATLSYEFEIDHAFDKADDGSKWSQPILDGVRKGRLANVMMVYCIDRAADSVKFVRGHDLTAMLFQFTAVWEDYRDYGLDGENSDMSKLTSNDISVVEVSEYKDAGSYVLDFSVRGRIALLCCKGCDYIVDDSYMRSHQGHLVCFDLLIGEKSWSVPCYLSLDQIGPISPDGSAALLQNDESILGVSFKELEEGESWGPARSWPVERERVGEYCDSTEMQDVEGREEVEGESEVAPQRQLGLRSLLFRQVAVWHQKRVQGRLANHLLYL